MKNKYSIGEASRLCQIPVKTLRYYDTIGLLCPEFRNTENNYRYYSKEQLTTLLIIRRMRAQGFSIKDIQDLVGNPDLPHFQDRVAARCQEIDEEILLLYAKKESCLYMLDRIRQGHRIVSEHPGREGGLTEEICLEKVPEDTMYFSRELMKRYINADVSLQRWTDIYEKCTELGLKMKSPVIVTFHNQALDQFLMKDCDVEFGVCVEGPDGEPPKLPNIRSFGGFCAAVIYHLGDYSKIMQSHVALLQWINQNGYELAGPVSEEFILSPLDVNDEAQYVTKVMMPVKKV